MSKSRIDQATEEVLNEIGLNGSKIMEFLVRRAKKERREQELNAEQDRQEEILKQIETGF